MVTQRSSRFLGEFKDYENGRLDIYVNNPCDTLVGRWDDTGSDLTLPTNGLTISGGGASIVGDVTLNCGADLIFTGTTGQSQVLLTDNLADSLSVLISGGSDFLVFKTTNCSEVLSSAVDRKLTGGNMLMTKRTVTTDSTCGNNTWTIAEFLGGLMLRDPVGCDRTDVTPTAALIVAAIPCATVDDTFETTIVNIANGDCENFTLALGTDVTMIPATLIAERRESLHLIVRLTCVGACEKVTIYGSVFAGT